MDTATQTPTTTPALAPVTAAELAAYTEALDRTAAENHAARGFTFEPTTYAVDPGGRAWIRIVARSGGTNRSAFMFVEAATGLLYKAASWKGPAAGSWGSATTSEPIPCRIQGLCDCSDFVLRFAARGPRVHLMKTPDGHTPRSNDGRYVEHERCEACGKAIKGEYMSDPATLAVSALGLTLCARVRCLAKREALTVEQKLELYAKAGA